MNEELQKALSELLGKANNGIDAASGFLVAELPDVIQQLLMWHGVYNFTLFLIGVIAALALPKLASVITRKPEGEGNFFWDDRGGFSEEIAPTLIAIFGGAFVVIMEFIFIFDFINIKWLQIWIAPKVWLIEYAAKLTA